MISATVTFKFYNFNWVTSNRYAYNFETCHSSLISGCTSNSDICHCHFDIIGKMFVWLSQATDSINHTAISIPQQKLLKLKCDKI